MRLTAKRFLQSCLRQCTMNCLYQNKNERTTEVGRNRIHGKRESKTGSIGGITDNYIWIIKENIGREHVIPFKTVWVLCTARNSDRLFFAWLLKLISLPSCSFVQWLYLVIQINFSAMWMEKRLESKKQRYPVNNRHKAWVMMTISCSFAIIFSVTIRCFYAI